MAAKWTVLVYLAGNNSLSGEAGKDLSEMRKIGSSPSLNILTFVKRSDGKGAQRMRIETNGGEKIESLGDLDSGDPKTVREFIEWGLTTAPADHYAVVLWNHGGGWEPDDLEQLYAARGAGSGVNRRELNHRSSQPAIGRAFFSTTAQEILSQPNAGERQILNDDGTGHSLDTLELGKVVGAAATKAGRTIDVLGMDACLMSTLEVAYQVRDSVNVVVGSEAEEPGAGWPYDRILGDLAANPDVDGQGFGRTVVTRYVDSYRNKQTQWPVTQCAIDTTRAGDFANSVDGLVLALRPALANKWNDVVRAQMRAIHFASGLVDLGTFCQNLRGTSLGSGIQTAARAVLAAMSPGGYVISEAHLGKQVTDCAGISVYLPSPERGISKYYRDLQFAKKHKWDEFLSAYHGAIRGS